VCEILEVDTVEQVQHQKTGSTAETVCNAHFTAINSEKIFSEKLLNAFYNRRTDEFCRYFSPSNKKAQYAAPQIIYIVSQLLLYIPQAALR
jgi:hypothetical protein